MSADLSIFKDYDIRGIYPTQINGKVAKKIASALAIYFKPTSIAIGRDMRLSGEEIRDAFVEEFTRLGISVYDAGVIGTEIQYFIAASKPYDLILMITASHNPKEYNGLKVVKLGAIPVSSDSGLYAVRDLINETPPAHASTRGSVKSIEVFNDWSHKILSLATIKNIKPLHVVIDAGNGMGGKLAPLIFNNLPVSIEPLYFELDGSFPHHVPNPLIEKNTIDMKNTLLGVGADVGFAFDGDADRTFVMDDKGRMVSGTITTALLAKYILKHHPQEMILYNAVCGRVVPETIEALGGKAKRVRVGHSYIKQYMRETNAIFAGEHSGHYYYRDYYYSESAMLTALYILELLSIANKPLSQLVDQLNKYPSSGEINFMLKDSLDIFNQIKQFHHNAISIDELDGISIWYDSYWFNVRASKTEPLVRLNIEADDVSILNQQKEKLIGEITQMGGRLKE